MNNADVFKRVFGIYAEEFWSYTEKQMLDWINADVPDKNVGDMISRQAAIDKFIDGLEKIFAYIRDVYVDDSVCVLCEYDGVYIGEFGYLCKCPGFDKDDCFKLRDKIRKKWTNEIIKAVPSAETKWIPVTERLPEDDSDVLITFHGENETRIVPVNYAQGIWFDCIFDIELNTHGVTSWMPLPEPYKGERKW